MVTAADVGDRAAAHILLEPVAAAYHRLALVWADGWLHRHSCHSSSAAANSA